MLLPLFPLQMVLLPGTVIPLHIFEERYKELIGNAIEQSSEFGIVQAGEKGILNTGCTATIEEVLRRYPDGKMDVLAIGRRRFEIILLNEEESYLRAQVEFFDDDASAETPSEELRAVAVAGFLRLQLLEEGELPDGAPDASDPQLSFKLAHALEDLDVKQVLLSMRSEVQRLKHIVDYLPAHIARQRRISHVKRIAPTNGHAHVSIEDQG